MAEKEQKKKKGFFSTLLRRKSTDGGAAEARGGGGGGGDGGAQQAGGAEGAGGAGGGDGYNAEDDGDFVPPAVSFKFLTSSCIIMPCLLLLFCVRVSGKNAVSLRNDTDMHERLHPFACRSNTVLFNREAIA